MLDKGVCVLDTLAPPQCKHNISPFIPHPEVAGKQASLLYLHQASPLRRQPPDPGEPIAASETVSSQPTNTSVEGEESWRNARNCDEGVCVADALTLPQCEFKSVTSPPSHPEIAGEQESPLELHPSRRSGYRTFKPAGPCATAEAVSLHPTNTSEEGVESWGNAGNCDEGVCVADALTLPQCESKRSHPTRFVVPAGKPLPSLGQTQPTRSMRQRLCGPRRPNWRPRPRLRCSNNRSRR
jgi:hypothetical protein